MELILGFVTWTACSSVLHLSVIRLHVLIAAQSLLTTHADATCNVDQIDSCRNAARSGEIEELSGGGQCMVKQYIQYTHLCTVNNYLPNVDYCCCSYETRVFCCRYHQDWYHFRCMDSEDSLDYKDPVSAKEPLSWRLILPVVLCTLVALVVFSIVGYIQLARWRHKRHASPNINCCRSIEKQKNMRDERSYVTDDDAVTPLPVTSLSPSVETDHHAPPPSYPQCNTESRTYLFRNWPRLGDNQAEPSAPLDDAPPYSEVANLFDVINNHEGRHPYSYGYFPIHSCARAQPACACCFSRNSSGGNISGCRGLSVASFSTQPETAMCATAHVCAVCSAHWQSNCCQCVAQCSTTAT